MNEELLNQKLSDKEQNLLNQANNLYNTDFDLKKIIPYDYNINNFRNNYWLNASLLFLNKLNNNVSKYISNYYHLILIWGIFGQDNFKTDSFNATFINYFFHNNEKNNNEKDNNEKNKIDNINYINIDIDKNIIFNIYTVT